MTTPYKIDFVNSTDQPLYFVVYQTSPLDQLDSVAWQVRGLPPTGTDHVSWTMDYGIALVDFDDYLMQYKTIKTVGNTYLGSVYPVTANEGIPDISGNAIGLTSSPDQMAIENQANVKVNTGFMLGEQLIGAERGVGGREISVFNSSKYYTVIAYSGKVVPGQIIKPPVTGVTAELVAGTKDPRPNFVIPQIQISFPSDVFECTVEAHQQQESYSLKKTQ